MKFFILCLLIAFLSAEEPHHTTAFIGTQEAMVSYSRYATDHFWNKRGKKLPAFNSFKENSYALYAEYPLNRENSLFLNGGYSTVSESMNGTSQAVQDVEIGWKHLFNSTETSALTGEITSIIPAGHKKASIRYGKWGLQLALLYSAYLSEQVWLDSGIGYRAYEGYPSDQLRGFITLGYCMQYLAFIITGETEWGGFNGRANGNRNNIVFNANYRLVQGKMECMLTIMEHFSASLGGFYRIWGQSCGTGGGYFCGAWLIF